MEYTEYSDTTSIAPEQNYELNLILSFKEKKDNLIELNVSEINYSFDNGDKNDLLFIEKFKLQFYNGLPSLTQEEYEWISSHIDETNPHTPKQIYLYVELVKILSHYYLFQNQTEKEWVTKLKGIHQLEKIKGNKLQKAKDELYSDFAISVSRETEIKMYDKFLSFLIGKISNEFFSTFEGMMFRSYMMEEGFLGSAKDRLEILNEASKIASSPFQKMTVLLNLGYYHSEFDQLENAKVYFRRALNLFSDQCSIYFYYTLAYLMSIDNDKILKEKLFSYKQCTALNQNLIQFLIPNYLEGDGSWFTKDEYLNLLTISREKADILYSGHSSLHLQDFYTRNYTSFLNQLKDEKNIQDNISSQIINLAQNTKDRELQRQRMESTKYGDPIRNKKIKKHLHSLNEFKEYFPEKIDLYDSLFKLYRDINPMNISNSYQKINLNELKSKMKLNNDIILNITNSQGLYMMYYYDGTSLTIESLSKDNLKDFSNQNMSISGSPKSIPNESLVNPLSYLNIPSDKNLIIIPDGVFTSLPLDQLFQNKKVLIYNSVKSYLKQEIKTIANVSTYSYSSPATIEDRTLKKFPELRYSLIEIDSISSILRNKGINTMKSKFNNINKIEVLHLSTHAYSSSINRLNNFFLYRDKQGTPIKKYGYEIYDQLEVPDVVILSACESGLGMPAYGAGVQTLSRAFLDNGTQTVIKTLWKVNEKATAEFMIEMYTHWVTGISLYDALEKTKANFENHEEYAHPYYWAGFVLEGNPHVYLEQPENSNN